jgi:hypothetical protein
MMEMILTVPGIYGPKAKQYTFPLSRMTLKKLEQKNILMEIVGPE